MRIQGGHGQSVYRNLGCGRYYVELDRWHYIDVSRHNEERDSLGKFKHRQKIKCFHCPILHHNNQLRTMTFLFFMLDLSYVSPSLMYPGQHLLP